MNKNFEYIIFITAIDEENSSFRYIKFWRQISIELIK